MKSIRLLLIPLALIISTNSYSAVKLDEQLIDPTRLPKRITMLNMLIDQKKSLSQYIIKNPIEASNILVMNTLRCTDSLKTDEEQALYEQRMKFMLQHEEFTKDDSAIKHALLLISSMIIYQQSPRPLDTLKGLRNLLYWYKDKQEDLSTFLKVTAENSATDSDIEQKRIELLQKCFTRLQMEWSAESSTPETTSSAYKTFINRVTTSAPTSITDDNSTSSTSWTDSMAAPSINSTTHTSEQESPSDSIPKAQAVRKQNSSNTPSTKHRHKKQPVQEATTKMIGGKLHLILSDGTILPAQQELTINTINDYVELFATLNKAREEGYKIVPVFIKDL